jgi:hypothetical protein
LGVGVMDTRSCVEACRLVAVKEVLPNALTADQIGTAVKKVLPYALTTDEIGTAVKKVLPNAPTADEVAKAVIKIQLAVPTEDAILERVSSAVNSIVKEVERILPSVPAFTLPTLRGTLVLMQGFEKRKIRKRATDMLPVIRNATGRSASNLILIPAPTRDPRRDGPETICKGASSRSQSRHANLWYTQVPSSSASIIAENLNVL